MTPEEVVSALGPASRSYLIWNWGKEGPIAGVIRNPSGVPRQLVDLGVLRSHRKPITGTTYAVELTHFGELVVAALRELVECNEAALQPEYLHGGPAHADALAAMHSKGLLSTGSLLQYFGAPDDWEKP